MVQQFPVVIERDEDGYFIISCPILKGCHSYGETIDEAMRNIKEAIELCLEDEKPQEYIGISNIEVEVY